MNRIHQCVNTLATLAAAAAIALAILAPAASRADEAEPTVDAVFAEGVRHYQRGEYAQALKRLRLAAEYGETEAAELTGFMYLVGERLYGPGVPVDLAQARKWLHIAAIKGSRAAVLPLRAIVVATSAATE